MEYKLGMTGLDYLKAKEIAEQGSSLMWGVDWQEEKAYPCDNQEVTITKENEVIMEGMPLQDLIKEHGLKEGDEVTCCVGGEFIPIVGIDYKITKSDSGACGLFIGTIDTSTWRNVSYISRTNKFIVKEHSNKLTEKTPHCALKHLWADGAIIQFEDIDGCWMSAGENPEWKIHVKYRVKPREYTDTEMLEWMAVYSAFITNDKDVEKFYLTWVDSLGGVNETSLSNSLREAITKAMNASEQD